MGLGAALSFLSRLPSGSLEAEALASALPWFPVAGLIVGAVLGLAATLEFLVLPTVAAFLFVPTYFAVKGILHTDGLADTADALAVHGSAEDRDRVLRDPHVGVAGAIAVGIFVVGLFALLDSARVESVPLGLLAPLFGPLDWSPLMVLVLAELTATTTMVAAFLLAPLSPHSRLANALASGSSRRAMVTGGVVGVVLLVLLGGLVGILLAAAALAVAYLVGRTARRWFAGLSGDLLGAGHDVAFLLALVVAEAWLWAR